MYVMMSETSDKVRIAALNERRTYMWKTVLFDLDGTLTDSAEGITKCVQYALVELGFEAPELSELNCFVGPPLHEMFMKYAGLDEETANKAVALYRERYVPTGMFENQLYPSIKKLLDLLKKNGITMGVASSKPEVYVKQILEHFGIDSYFKVVVGSELNGDRVKKNEVLEEAIRRLHMENRRDQIVLIGDTAFDVRGAHAVDIDCIGVSYGYGDRRELEGARPIYIADTVSDIAECVLSCEDKPKRESSIYQVWRIMYPILMHLGISLFVYSGMAVALAIYKLLVYGNYSVELIMQSMINHNTLMMIGISGMSILVFGWFFRRDEWKRKELGLRNRLMTASKFGIRRMIMVAVFFILLGMFLNQLIEWSQIAVLFDGYDTVAQVLFDKKAMILAYISVGILAPAAEELAFRGLVYRRVRDYMDVKWAIIISSLLFGLYHGNVVQFIYAALLGVALAAVYERYKTLWAPVLAHMAVNGFSCIAEFAGVPLMPNSTKGLMLMFAVEILLISVLGVCILRKWKPKNKKEEVNILAETESLDEFGLERESSAIAVSEAGIDRYSEVDADIDADGSSVDETEMKEGIESWEKPEPAETSEAASSEAIKESEVSKISEISKNSELSKGARDSKEKDIWDEDFDDGLDDDELDRIIAAYAAKMKAERDKAAEVEEKTEVLEETASEEMEETVLEKAEDSETAETKETEE